MNRVSILAVALMLNSAQPLWLGTALSIGAGAISVAPALAQSAENVAKGAQAITVRIEGATQGSGVLVKRDSNRYTVLTAWHVVSGQKPGEELDIYTSDGQRHPVDQGSIKRLGQVDLAVLTFSSQNPYEIARVGDVKSATSGKNIYVSGFPLPTSAVPSRLFRFLKGDVIANASVAIPNGYQLLYSNQTLPGMSGGAVLNDQAQLVGIHASAERADQISESSGKAVATGTNQGVPVTYYLQYSQKAAVTAHSAQASSADDFLAQAKALLGKKGSEKDVIRLSTQILAIRGSADAFFYRAYAKDALGDKQGAIEDYSQVLLLDPQDAFAMSNLGTIRGELGDYSGAIANYSKAIDIYPEYGEAYFNRAFAKFRIGDSQGAIADYTRAIAIDPDLGQAYSNRGSVRYSLGDMEGAIIDYDKAISINPQGDKAYKMRGDVKNDLGDKNGSIADYSQAILINPNYGQAYFARGHARYGIRDMKGAMSDFNQAITINPEDASALGMRGIVKVILGDTRGACEDTRRSALLGSSVSRQLLQEVCK